MSFSFAHRAARALFPALTLILFASACGTPATQPGDSDATESQDIDLNDINLDTLDVNLGDVDLKDIDLKDIDIAGLDISLDGFDIALDVAADVAAGTDVAGADTTADDATADAGADAALADAEGTDAAGADTTADDAASQPDSNVVPDAADDVADGGSTPDAAGDADDAGGPDDAGAVDTTPADDTAGTNDATVGEDAADAAGPDVTPPECTGAGQCEDGNLCTLDSCDAAGNCQHTDDSAKCNDGNPCTDDACNPATGLCLATDNTATCDDGSLCTQGDVCGGGTCQPGAAKDCSDSDPCTDNGCDPTTGTCTSTYNTAPCNDGMTCTYDDVCDGQDTCKGTVGDQACNDGNDCTLDQCDVGSDTCSYTAQNVACSDGNPCTGGDHCVAGTCETPEYGTAADDQASTEHGKVYNLEPYGNYVDSAIGQYFVAGQSGALESIEVQLDTVQPTFYGYSSYFLSGYVTLRIYDANNTILGLTNVDFKALDDGSQPMTPTGGKGTVFLMAGVYLEAGKTYRFGVSATSTTGYSPSCTTSGGVSYCKGSNVGMASMPCSTSQDCHWTINLATSSSDAAYPDGHAYSEYLVYPGPQALQEDVVFRTRMKPAYNQAVNGTACTDGLDCTSGDACSFGACVAKSDCDDKIACTMDACSPTGCTFTPDNSLCNDGDVCTNDACDLALGCTVTGFAPDGTNCNSGNPCVISAVCASGKCAEDLVPCDNLGPCLIGFCNKAMGACDFKPPVCPDDGPCKIGMCNNQTGCSFYYPVEPCEDGDPCTAQSSCDGAGTCAPTFGIPGLCGPGAACTLDGQCSHFWCNNGTCADSTCGSGKQELTETGFECGGTCATGCGFGVGCKVDTDCAAPLLCTFNACMPPP